MATEGNCAPNSEKNTLSHSEKEAKLAELWYQVVRNPEFKVLFLGYTLEQLARHSELKSIENYCNYHQVKIPSSEEEEDNGSDAGGSQSSVRDAEETRRPHASSRGHRDSRSYATSSRSPQGATSSKTAGKQNYDPNRHGPIGTSNRVPNTGGSPGRDKDPKIFTNAPWRDQSKDSTRSNKYKDRS